jgi:hypothetical protein
MKAYLKDGPANGRVIPHPHLFIYRVPVPKPIDSLSINDCLQEAINTAPNYDIADYQFSGQATVNIHGEVQLIMYQFTGME